MNTLWRVWDRDNAYGELLYKRAVGDLPEMESSKRIARELRKIMNGTETILDVGCGAGHYLRSLRRELGESFSYVGCDATERYIDLAKRAFSEDARASFRVSDIFSLDFAENSFDIVICNNLLLHLPSIEKPLQELIRVAKRKVIVRTLCGNRSFRIMDVAAQEDGGEFLTKGDPKAFYYYNIYSQSYFSYLLSANSKVRSWEMTEDVDFDKKRIEESAREHSNINATRILGNYQVNGYILQPWAILTIAL